MQVLLGILILLVQANADDCSVKYHSGPKQEFVEARAPGVTLFEFDTSGDVDQLYISITNSTPTASGLVVFDGYIPVVNNQASFVLSVTKDFLGDEWYRSDYSVYAEKSVNARRAAGCWNYYPVHLQRCSIDFPKTYIPSARTGTNHTFTWQATTFSSVSVGIFKDQPFHWVTATEGPNVGFYTWSVPSDLIVGDDYHLAIGDLNTYKCWSYQQFSVRN